MVLKNNGFEIEYCKYSDKEGNAITPLRFNHQGNAIIWLVARKVKVTGYFKMPIQDRQEIHESYRQENNQNFTKLDMQEDFPWEDTKHKGQEGKAGRRTMSFFPMTNWDMDQIGIAGKDLLNSR